MDPTRIADLRRRLQADPTSIVFAQLAEELRRAGELDEAVSVCRERLELHPGYLSARVTLGRALAELERWEDAERELEYVLESAPDSLAAIRGLAEIHEKQGNLPGALAYYRRALALAKYDPDLGETVQSIAHELGGDEHRQTDEGLSFEQAQQELMDAPSRVPEVTPRVDFDEVLQSLGYQPDAPAPPVVEAWLSGQPLPAAPASEPPPAPPAAADEKVGADLLAQLEADLRQLERRPAPIDRSPSTAHLTATDRMVIAELELWLAGIAARRRALPRLH